MDANQKDKLMLLMIKSFLENSQDMVFVKDTNLVYVAASTSFAELVGKKRGEELIGKTDFELFNSELAEKYTRDDRRVLGSGVNVIEYIEPLPNKDGKKSSSSTSKYAIYDENGNIAGLYGVAKDVTARLELEAEQERSRLSRQMFDSVIEADITEDKLLRLEGTGWIKKLNLPSVNLFADAVNIMAKYLIHPDYVQEFLLFYDIEKLKTDYRLGIHEFSHITYLLDVNDEYKWISCKSRVYHSRISDTLRITMFFKDMDDEIKDKKQLQKKAATDALTNLNNRESAFEQINTCLLESSKMQCHALMFIDLDCFKQVNDHWGHQFGDKVLQRMAERLKEVFCGDEIIGRVGGDEFIVFLKKAPPRDEIKAKAEMIVKKLTLHLCEDGIKINVTCSVGITVCQNGSACMEEMYEQADRAMYRAKKDGRNRVFFYDDL